MSLVVGNTVAPFHRRAETARPSHFEVTIESSVGGIAQLYFDRGANFNEGDSVAVPIAAGVPTPLALPIPATSVRALRLDPINGAGTVTISEARLRDPAGRVIREFPPDDFTGANQIARLERRDRTVAIEVTAGGNDPFLFIELGAAEIKLPIVKPNWLTPILKRGALAFAGVAPLLLLALFAADKWRDRLLGIKLNLRSWTVANPKQAIAAIALVATVLSCYPVLFTGASFVSPNYGTALLYDDYPTLPGSKASQIVDPRGADVGAIMWQHVPLSMVQSRALFDDFEIPLWNRYNSGGTVLLGQGQSMFGEPLHFLVLLAGGSAWSWDVKYLLAKWLLGLGLGLVVWHTTRHLAAALIVGFASVFVGFFVFRVNHPAYFSFCYGPWVLYAWCCVVAATDRRKLLLALFGLIAANWALLTSGTAKEAYVSLFTMNLAGTVTLLVAPFPARERLLRLGATVAAGVAFVMLSAPIWLTFYDAMTASYSSYNAAYAFQLQPGLALGFFDELLLRPFWAGENVYNPSSNFLILGGVLAFLANIRTIAVNRYALGFGLAALVPAAFVFGLVPPRWIVLLPILGNIHHIDNSFGVGLIHLFAVLAGFGFASWAERLGKPEGRADLAIAGLLLLALVAHYIGLTQTVQRSTRTFLLWGQSIPRSEFVWGSFALLLAALITLPLVVRRALLTRTIGAGGILIIATCGLALLWRHGMQARSQHPDHTLNAAPRPDFSRESPSLQALRQDMDEPARAFGFAGNLFPGWNNAYAVESINGPDAIINRHMRELQAAFGVERIWDWRLLVYPDGLAPVRPFFDVMNVRYFLDYRGDPSRLRDQLHLLKTSDLDLYRSNTAWPRAFFTDRLAVYKDPADFAALVRLEPSRPLAAIQAKDALEFPAAISRDASSRQIVPAARYTLTNNSTSFTVTTPGPGVVVLSEAWLKDDFAVTVNGRATDYFRVNHAFKGVTIDRAGTHEISFTYRPRRWTLSMGLALLGVVACGTAYVAVARFERPQTSH